ncbi:MAG: porin [Tabrizicola sp.]
MKKLLLVSTVLGLSAGVAAADISLSGDARMGIIDDFGAIGPQFNSRARVKFTLSGESDTGISFGASFRADNAGGAASGTAGEVFVSGAFGKLSMGDVDGAAQAAVGQVSGVGYTGLSDLNEIAYLLGGEDPSALYEFATGDLAFYVSVQPNNDNTNFGLGASYTMGNYKVAIGYESLEDNSVPGSGWPDKIGFAPFFGNGATQVVLGADATFGPVTGKVRFARYSEDNVTAGMDQSALSLDYAVDALTVTAYYSNYRGTDLYDGTDGDFYGLGAAYDLGGGASVAGGYVKNETTDEDAIDLGMNFKF